LEKPEGEGKQKAVVGFPGPGRFGKKLETCGVNIRQDEKKEKSCLAAALLGPRVCNSLVDGVPTTFAASLA
jgi:hypothetical protein